MLKRPIAKADDCWKISGQALTRAGLDYDTMKSLNDKIIYCSISGFAEDGLNARRPPFDTIGQALSGMLHLFVDLNAPMMRGPHYC